MGVNVLCSGELTPLSELRPHPKNRNEHSPEQINRLCKLFEAIGVRHPIIVSNRSGFIVAGHARLAAAKKLSMGNFPVSRQDFESEEQEYAFLVSDNAIADWADLDLKGIGDDVLPFGPDFDLDLLGIKDFTLDASEQYEGGIGDDEIPETPPARTQAGDLYRLGSHRLLCGDSTRASDVEILMNGEKAELFLTDPPYGVSYADKNAYLNTIAPGNRIQVDIENDHGTIEETGEIWLAAYQAAIANRTDRASFYIFSPQGGDLMMMMMMIQKAGWTLKHMLVWVKNNHVLGRCDYHYKHEPIFYGWNKRHDFYGGSCCFSVLQYPKPLKNDLHPTMKPIELLEHLVKNSSLENGAVLDLFLGSGSTLIACEKTNRRCFGMEIDPHYCDVIIERWEKFSGKKAEKLNG